MLRAGAADGAVATAAALNVTEPVMPGIGGDCFALYYEADSGEISAPNGSGRAPAALDLARIEATASPAACRASTHTPCPVPARAGAT